MAQAVAESAWCSNVFSSRVVSATVCPSPGGQPLSHGEADGLGACFGLFAEPLAASGGVFLAAQEDDEPTLLPADHGPAWQVVLPEQPNKWKEPWQIAGRCTSSPEDQGQQELEGFERLGERRYRRGTWGG